MKLNCIRPSDLPSCSPVRPPENTPRPCNRPLLYSSPHPSSSGQHDTTLHQTKYFQKTLTLKYFVTPPIKTKTNMSIPNISTPDMSIQIKEPKLTKLMKPNINNYKRFRNIKNITIPNITKHFFSKHVLLKKNKPKISTN